MTKPIILSENALRLVGMDMTVFGYDPFASLHSPFSGMVQTKDELLSHLSEYDYVISTVPATTTSEKLCDTDSFRNMKRTAVLLQCRQSGDGRH